MGENIERVRYDALPLAVLALSLRGWRPLRLALPVVVLAASWNITPLAANFAHAGDPAASASYWRPAIGYLRTHLNPSYRVEAVDTAGHWAAVYLPEARIPLARGWYRQDDFPENRILYGDFGADAYLGWLRKLAVRYVVLTDAQPDYSAAAETELLRTSRSGLRPVFRSTHLTVFGSPRASPARDRAVPRERAQDRANVDQPARRRPRKLSRRGSLFPVRSIQRGDEPPAGRHGDAARPPRAAPSELAFKVGAVRALETLVGADANDCSS